MADVYKLVTALVFAATQVIIPAHAAPPVAYDQWQVGRQCNTVANPDAEFGACPTGFVCGSAITGDGFLQRSLVAENGKPHYQLLVTGSGVSDVPTNIAATLANSSRGPYAYLINEGAQAIDTIDLGDAATLSLADNSRVETAPQAVAVSPNGAFLYIANADSTITVMRAYDRQVVTTITVPALPTSLLIHDARLYVTHVSGNVITVIDLASKRVIDSLITGSTFGQLLIHPDGEHLYGLNAERSEILVFDAHTGATIATHSLPSAATQGRMVLTPAGDLLYVALSDGSSTRLYELTTATGVLREAPKTYIGAVSQLLMNAAANQLLLSTTHPAASACSNAKNGLYVLDTALLVPSVIRHMNLGEEVIASDASDIKLVLNRDTGFLYRMSADTQQRFADVQSGSRAARDSQFVGPVLQASLSVDTPSVDFGAVAVGTSSTRTLAFRNNGALPFTVTGFDLYSTTSGLHSSVALDGFSLSDDRCSGHTLLPDEQCSVEITQRFGAAGGKGVRLVANTDAPSLSASATLTAQAQEAEPLNTGMIAGGGGLWTPCYLLIAAIYWRRRRCAARDASLHHG